MSLLLLNNKKKKDIVKNGLVLWLDGKDFTNSPPTGLLRDKSGNGNNATPIGMAYTTTSGSDNNGGIAFDGVDDIMISNLAMSQNSYTIQLKVKCLYHTMWKGIISLVDVAGINRIATLYYDQNAGVLSFTTNNNMNLSFAYILNTVMDITLVFNGTTKKVFINGIQVASISGNVFTSSIGKVCLGNSNITEFSKSICYSAKVYNRALTNAEILQNYNASK